MGMFDWINVDYPLPIDVDCDLYQTKDLGSYMNEYTITEQGLFIDTETKELNVYNGEFEFYKSERLEDDTHVWLEFRATFTDGMLRKLTQTSPVVREVCVDNFKATTTLIKRTVDDLLQLLDELPMVGTEDIVFKKALEDYKRWKQ